MQCAIISISKAVYICQLVAQHSSTELYAAACAASAVPGLAVHTRMVLLLLLLVLMLLSVPPGGMG
jgi:hypothetical protein